MKSETPMELDGAIFGRLNFRLFVICVAILLSGLLLGSLGVGVIGTGWREFLIAWIAGLLVAVLAHLGGEFPKGTEFLAVRLAIQMVVRTVPLMALAIWGINFAVPPLETSLVFYILAFYLIGLVADVQMHLFRLRFQPHESDSKQPQRVRSGSL
jgi:hypothetical protein